MEIYIDDMLIYGKTEEEFLTNLERVLQRAREWVLTFNPSKCRLGLHEVEFVGHIINAEGIKMSDEKKFKVVDFERPRTVKKMQSFLGLVNYFHDFVEHYDRLTKPLFDVMKAVKVNKKLVWTEEADRAFQEVKAAIMDCPQLYFLDKEGQVILETDASDYGVGAVLYQVVEDKKHIVAFMSKILDSTQRNWSTIEKEAFAIFHALKHFETLLLGRHFLLRTDHANLRYFNNKTPKVVRRKCAVQEFDFDVEHIEGVQNSCADAFSRLIGEEVIDDSTKMVSIRSEDSRGIVMAVLNDVVIPSDKRELIQRVHGLTLGHLGVDKTLIKLRELTGNKLWKNARAHVQKFISTCDVCQKTKHFQYARIAGRFTLSSHRPMELLSMDTLGPFKQAPDGSTHVLVIIDCFSRFIELYPVKSVSAEDALPALLWHVGRYGVPTQIVSDNGPQFVNALIDAFMRCAGTQYDNILPYSHEENGIVERANREIQRHLRNILYEKNVKDNWQFNLPLVMRIMNSTIHDSTGVALSALIYGESVLLDKTIFFDHEVSSGRFKGAKAQKTYQEYVEKMLDNQAAVIAAAQKHLAKRDERHLNQAVTDNPTKFDLGDYVLISNPALVADKGAMYWEGPFKIIKKDSILTDEGVKERDDSFIVQDIATGQTFAKSAHYMKLFSYEDENGLLAIRRKDTNEWVVEAILQHSGNETQKSQMDFLVKWEGLDEAYNRWLPWKELRNNVKLHEYLRVVKLGKLIPKEHREKNN